MEDTITIQEVRRDPAGFFKRISNGQSLVVIARSKPLIRVKGESLQALAQPKGSQHFLDIAEEARKSAKVILDPSKTTKELYHEALDEKYGLR